VSRFSEIIGQRDAIVHLQNCLRTGHIPHAVILAGEEGSGKMALASAFANTLVCRNRQEENGRLEPCGTCRDCLQAKAGSHPDINVVTPAKVPESGKTPVLGVDDVRRFRADVQIKPYQSDWKIYIVPHAERMTPQAQNALLKTLEEPPAYAVILLLADSLTGFLPTVLSRCIALRMKPTPEAELTKVLMERCGADLQSAKIAGRLSGGNAGRAMSLLQDEEAAAFRQQAVAFLRDLPRQDAFQIHQFAADLGTNAPVFLDLASCWYRDIAVLKATGETGALIFQDEVRYSIQSAQNTGFPALLRIQESLAKARLRRARGGNDAQVLEMLLLEIRDACRGRAS
jgi:DNA polymerase-3 subunit delta'